MLLQFGLRPTRSKLVAEGAKFGRLAVLAVGSEPPRSRIKAVCQCECGAVLAVRIESLLNGITVSCGCFHAEVVTTHGLTKSGHYGRWRHMMSRCFNPSDQAFPSYGGRGISVCEAWRTIEGFVAGLPDGYWPGAEIDRIDNDGDYEPGNVRWSTPKGNANNRRSTTALTFNGQTKTQREWARELDIDERVINTRLKRLGWTVEAALTTPVQAVDDYTAKARATRWAGHDTKGRPAPKTSRRLLTVEHYGKQMTMAELSAICGVSTKQLRRRIVELGWPVDRAVIP